LRFLRFLSSTTRERYSETFIYPMYLSKYWMIVSCNRSLSSIFWSLLIDYIYIHAIHRTSTHILLWTDLCRLIFFHIFWQHNNSMVTSLFPYVSSFSVCFHHNSISDVVSFCWWQEKVKWPFSFPSFQSTGHVILLPIFFASERQILCSMLREWNNIEKS
jgi:hypothetical protein